MAWAFLQHWLVPPRSLQQELLDADDIPEHDLQGNLGDLRWLNAVLGSRWLVLRGLASLWQHAGRPEHLRVLDVGTGAGDIPQAVVKWARSRRLKITVVGLDNHAGTLRYAAAALRHLPQVTLVRASGLALPCKDQTFDIVLCSTMLHHLPWQEATELLRSMATAARYGVIVNDLMRSRLHHYGARLLLPFLSRNRLTRHDGPLSVLRAYSAAEIRSMARAAGWQTAHVHMALGYRFFLVYSQPQL